MPPSAEAVVMDRRVLFATVILFAGGATGIGVAAFAFVGLDDPTPDATVVWESEPAGGGGTGAAAATVDGDTLVLQSTVEDGTRAVRALNAGEGTAWTTPLPDGTDGNGSDREPGGDGDPVEASGLTAGTLDGTPVVALTTADGRLVVLNAADGSERFVVDLGGPGGLAPAIGDPTGDGSVVAATTADGTVLAVDANAATVFRTPLDRPVDRNPVIVAPDSAPDGDVDSVAGGVAVSTGGAGSGAISDSEAGSGTVRFLGADGDVRWTATPSVTAVDWAASSTRRGPVLVLGGTNGNLETLEAADGSTRYDIGLQDRPIAVGDTGDGRVRVGGVGSVWAVSLLDGEVVWKQQYGGETRVNAPRLGDVAGDERVETVTVNRRGDVLATNRNGEAVVQGGVEGAVAYAGPLFADATGDGIDEVVVITEDGVVRALEPQ